MLVFLFRFVQPDFYILWLHDVYIPIDTILQLKVKKRIRAQLRENFEI